MGQESFSVGNPDRQHFFLLTKHRASRHSVWPLPYYRLSIFRDIKNSALLGDPLLGPVGNSDWGFGKPLQTLSTEKDHSTEPESNREIGEGDSVPSRSGFRSTLFFKERKLILLLRFGLGVESPWPVIRLIQKDLFNNRVNLLTGEENLITWERRCIAFGVNFCLHYGENCSMLGM